MSDIKQAWGASVDLTITLASLASDTNLLAGRSSAVIDNSSNKYLDFLVAGKIRLGTSPTVNKVIEIWAYGTFNDAFDYPDVIAGTDANKTITSTNVKNRALRLLDVITVDATTDRDYFFGPVSLVNAAYGGFGEMPKKWGLFVVHNTVAALNGTGGSFKISAQPVYKTVG